MLLLGMLVWVLVIPALAIMAFAAPARLNIRSPKNPTGRFARKPVLWGLAIAWLLLPVLLVQLDLVARESINQPTAHLAATANPAPAVTTSPTTAMPPVSPAEPVPTRVTEKDFGVTADEFGQRIAQRTAELTGENVRWHKGDFAPNAAGNVHTAALQENVLMNVAMTDDDKVKSVSCVYTGGKQQDDTAEQMLVLSGLVARSLNPTLSNDAAVQPLMDITKSAFAEYQQGGKAIERSTTAGQVRYTVRMGTGLSFIFTPV